MKYGGVLLAVKNMKESRRFYEEILNQKVTFDMGTNVCFENGLALQEGYHEIIGISNEEIHQKSNNFQIYFEVEDIEMWVKKLEEQNNIQYVHKCKEYPWGQRGMRIYDIDDNIVEIAETMDAAVKRFLNQGLSIEEVSKKTMYPIDIIEAMVK